MAHGAGSSGIPSPWAGCRARVLRERHRSVAAVSRSRGLGRRTMPEEVTPVAKTRQIAIVLYPGLTALDALGPYEVLKMLPAAEVRFLAHEPGPVTTDRGILII